SRIERVNATNNPERFQSIVLGGRLSNSNGCFRTGPPLPRSSDQEPKPCPQFADHAGDAAGDADYAAEDGVFIARVEHGCAEAEHIEEATKHQQEVQYSRGEA